MQPTRGTNAAPTGDSLDLSDLFSPTRPLRNTHALFRRLRDEQPVARGESLQGTRYVLTRYEDVRSTLKHEEVFSSRSNATAVGEVQGRTIVEMDGREHLRHRNIVTPALAPRALKGDFPNVVQSIANELVDCFAGAGRVDLVADFTFTFPLRVFTQILGLPVDDYEQVHHWSIDMTRIMEDPEASFAASRSLADYLRPHVEKRRSEPSGDLIGRLVEAEVEGVRLSDEEIISFLRLLVAAGAETTFHLIGSTLFALLTHPEQLEALRADRSLLQAILDETLRWESPIGLVTREALEPVEIAGTKLPAGSHLLLAIGSANRDERRFPEPDRFDPAREDKEHIAFGFGKHYCAGSRLAYLEAQVALNTLLDRLPNLRLDPEQDCSMVGLAFRGPDRLPVLFDPA